MLRSSLPVRLRSTIVPAVSATVRALYSTPYSGRRVSAMGFRSSSIRKEEERLLCIKELLHPTSDPAEPDSLRGDARGRLVSTTGLPISFLGRVGRRRCGLAAGLLIASGLTRHVSAVHGRTCLESLGTPSVPIIMNSYSYSTSVSYLPGCRVFTTKYGVRSIYAVQYTRSYCPCRNSLYPVNSRFLKIAYRRPDVMP